MMVADRNSATFRARKELLKKLLRNRSTHGADAVVARIHDEEIASGIDGDPGCVSKGGVSRKSFLIHDRLRFRPEDGAQKSSSSDSGRIACETKSRQIARTF